MNERDSWGMHVLYTLLALGLLIELCMFAKFLFGVP